MSDLTESQEQRLALAELIVRAAEEWLIEVAELRVADVVTEDLADHIAARVLFGWPERDLRLLPSLYVVDPDPTPAHGIVRPTAG